MATERSILEAHLDRLSAAETFEDFKAAQIKYVQWLIDQRAAEDKFKDAAYEWVCTTQAKISYETEQPAASD